MLNIVLVEPEIPQNTGNIARTCAVIGAKLHLVKPLGFDISEKAVKRAGLDYWDKVDIVTYENLDEFKKTTKDKNIYLLTTKGKKIYSDVKFKDDDYLIFGPESRGLPESYILDNFENAIRIPMGYNIRSLNLSNSVAIVAYEAMRQLDFKNLEEKSTYFDKK
ncbi:MAG: tRNA (uridine(34)/cytosine(34)/5-carboxymethylaminomethyluridine(34)-2'-O)-methyltransferase TrmL [Clostridia bacterium]